MSLYPIQLTILNNKILQDIRGFSPEVNYVMLKSRLVANNKHHIF